jgi:hypothetical protein
VIDTIRQASPFAPLPPEVADSQLSFIVPINYTRRVSRAAAGGRR